jgi:peptide chain release factor 1
VNLSKKVIKMSLETNMDRVLERRQDIEGRLANAAALSSNQLMQLSRELAEIKPVAQQVEIVRQLQQSLQDAKDIAVSETDDELIELARAETEELASRLPDEEHKLKLLLLPKDTDDARNAIIEVRAGTGGEEAALFASDLFGMYQRFAAKYGWRFEVMDISETGIGGYKEATANISGQDVFAKLKFESGVHRVQRVPETETGGRIHTSAATVAVLPEAQDVDIEINESDLRVDVFRASGPGGQSVNTTDSAVRITHLPTGIIVSQQDEKSQHKNRAKAMKILRARLYDAERARQQAERAASRKGQVGTGDRSERIRTYNFPQGRVTDHRINLTLYKLDKILAGESLEEVIDALAAEDQAARLAEGQEDG